MIDSSILFPFENTGCCIRLYPSLWKKINLDSFTMAAATVRFGRFFTLCQTEPFSSPNTGRFELHIFICCKKNDGSIRFPPIILVLYIQAYVEVNQFFADKAMEAVDSLVQQNKDVLPLVWVHDYHLTLAAALIRKVKQTICQRLLYEMISFLFDRVSVLFLIFRNSFQQAAEKGIRIKLGFFLHIPFPPWDIFRLLPWANQVLEGLLGCDMVGFHIEDYCLNFLDCCQRQLDYRVDKKNFTVEHEGRKISVRPLPIGIPFDKYSIQYIVKA